MKRIIGWLYIFIVTTLVTNAQTLTPFNGCPDNNLAIVRAGTNANDNNPISIYDINTSGIVTFKSGPILDPSGLTTNLQINGLGLNTKDGFLYGLNSSSAALLTFNTPLPFYRLDANAVTQQTGVMPGPAINPVAGETQSIVNPAAGEVDRSDNYYFTAATATANFFTQTLQVKRLFIGKLASLSTLPPSTTDVLNPTYKEITSTDINCADFIAALKAPATGTTVATGNNTGLKDLVFDAISGSLYSYVTYPATPGSSTYAGLMIKVDTGTGVMTAVGTPTIPSVANANKEVAGTLLDKNGNFLILFTDGSVYKAHTSAPNVFDGSIDLLTAVSGLPTVLRGDLASCGASALLLPSATFVCPSSNIAIVRAGTNSNDTNPISLYTVDGITGATSFLSGPILDPSGLTTNLQVNGLGLNSSDGYLYGLNSSSTAILTFNNGLPFYRVGADATAVQIGNVPGPAINPMAGETQSIVNAAAGDVDRSNNYYFTAATAIATFLPPTLKVTRLFIGKISSLSSLSSIPPSPPSSMAVLSPVYTEITSTDPNCTAFIASLKTPANATTVATGNNTGIKDFVFDDLSGMLYSYVTYPVTPGSSSYAGLMVKVDPATGIMTAIGSPSVQSFVSASNEVAGTLLDKNGNFLILFTNGQMYRANTSSPGIFDGSISLLNSSTGLPTVLRGDMASCGQSQLLVLPVTLNYFNAYTQGNAAILKWETVTEINTDRFIVERSENGISWSSIKNIAAAGNTATATQYGFTDNNIIAQTVFYRLKFVDKDGAFSYSAVKKLSFNAAGNNISYYPNPARNNVYVENSTAFSGNVKIVINDVTGKMYNPQYKKSDSNRISVDISSLPAGMYFLQITEGNGNLHTQKIVKQ